MAMELTEEQELQIFVKQMLKKRIFLGHYQERRYVESLGSYRDVVVITTSEHDLKKDLSTVKRKLMSFNKFSNLWVGITGPDTIGAPARYAVWVRLQNLAFGHYWFQVRQVKFVDGREMILSLKCIGPVDVDSMNMKVSESESDQEKHPEAPEPAPANSDTIFNYNEMKQKVRGSVKEMTTDFASVMTMHNIRQVFCFTSVFIVALITGLIRSIGYVGDYSIKFMREISFFIHACTPIIIAIIEVFGKCVGGFYLLIAMLWRGSYVKPPYTNSRHQQRSLQMPHHMQYHNN